ncbi:hypothetical protein [Spongiactinospora sp. TRM90649]|uniref:hypothetical protein n=1 Tax=Spongiactinospora sp. TRM90649 TaxID=3031114 RepID=UPI0023F99D07|nr:hypothetical protein [Spongiactinospora sp. TRM90649]MDF5751252.1 hypothetical protein [Spongiactinospora sp. TRM90649]
MNRRSVRSRAAVAVLVVVALGAIVILVARVLDPVAEVSVADLVGLLLAVIPLAVAVVTWARTRPSVRADVEAAAGVLAGLVERQWRDEARHRLLDDPEPMPVRWRLTSAGAGTGLPRLLGPGAEALREGGHDVPALARAFRGLDRPRLVITGGPGMGKTTLAVRLLLRLLADRAADLAAAGPGEIVPVPVLVPVSGWDPRTDPRLHDWLAVRLAQDYPALAAPELGPGAAAALATGGHILPVLDGLDEIGPQARARVIDALNASLDARDRLVLTSRTGEFGEAVAIAGRPLSAAAVIAPMTLPPQAGADYLRACLPAVPTEPWRRVLDALGAGTAPGLTAFAATPLGLWLIRAVYLDTRADPSPLAGPLGGDQAALRAHLLDRLIPALIATRPPSGDPADHFRPARALDPDATRRHLACLARRFPGTETRDIAWWRLARTVRRFPLTVAVSVALITTVLFTVMLTAGNVVMRLMLTGPSDVPDGVRDGLVGGSVIGAALSLAFGAAAGLAAMRSRDGGPPASWYRALGRRIVRGAPPGVAFGTLIYLLARTIAGPEEYPTLVLLGVLGALAVGIAAAGSWGEQPPGHAALSLRKHSGRRFLLRGALRGIVRGMGLGVLVGVICGLVFGLSISPLHGLALGVLGGGLYAFCFGPAIGLIRWLEVPLITTIGTPASSYRADRTLSLVRALIPGLVFGAMIGWACALLTPSLAYPQPAGVGFVFGLTFGFAFGAMFGLVSGDHHAWPSCSFTVARLALTRRLPWRLMAFLDDAHRLGLLRAVGPVYQFRHAALHDHLAAEGVVRAVLRNSSPRDRSATGSPEGLRS